MQQTIYRRNRTKIKNTYFRTSSKHCEKPKHRQYLVGILILQATNQITCKSTLLNHFLTQPDIVKSKSYFG